MSQRRLLGEYRNGSRWSFASRLGRILATLVILLGATVLQPEAAGAARPNSAITGGAVAHPLPSKLAPATAGALKLLNTQPRALPHSSPSRQSREVFGYATAGSLGDPTFGYPSWDFSLLSTVAYFAIHITVDGTIVNDSGWLTWNSIVATNLINTAHANGTKVVVTVDLHDFTSGTPVMCAALANRANTVAQAVASVAARGVDGVNLDYESVNGTCPNGQTSRSMMTDLMRQFRAALGSSYLSVATYASSASDPLGFFDVGAMSAYVDSFFVMAYDFEWPNYPRAPINCPTFCLGPAAPLTAYYWNDTSVVDQYLAVVPASQVILGVPYYGRKACVTGATPNAITTSSFDAETYLDAMSEINDPSVRPGSYVIHRDAHDLVGQERYDTWFNVNLNCTREMYIDDPISLGKKYDLVNNKGLRGVGFWTLNYGGGSPELWAALYSRFVACTSAGLSASPSPPQPAGTVVHFTATSTACNNPAYEFWLQYPNGTWVMQQAYGGGPSWNWNTAGLAAGTYTIHVWATQNGSSPASWQALGEVKYSVTRCATASISPSSGSQSAGSIVALTAASAGCPSPEYEFWVQDPSGMWSLKQPWGGAAFSWSTAGLSPGTYTIHAWVNTLGTSWEAIGSSTITLTGCTSASLSPPSATQAEGSTVSLTASSSGCPNPTYEFWVQDLGGNWSLKQGWGGPTFNWDTTGAANGTYTVHAWANQQGAASTLEVYGSSTVTLFSRCASASLTPASGSQSAGSTVFFIASSSGCVGPQYEFWVQHPGGAWYLKQGWGGSTFNWDTSGLAPGAYVIHAWVNHQGTGWDAIGSSTITLTGCTSASLSPSSPSQLAGTTLNFTAGSGGCPNPVFEFWVQDPSGAWTLKRSWGGPSFSWNTSGLAPGTYIVHAWANQQGAAPTLEVYGTSTVTLAPPCASASLSPAAGSAAAGGMITFTASSSGCPNPVYEFWLLDPSGTWHLMQAFTSGNTWQWSSAGWPKGSYTIHAWANEQGANPSTWEVIGSATYTLT